jgi:hypothetical protein
MRPLRIASAGRKEVLEEDVLVEAAVGEGIEGDKMEDDVVDDASGIVNCASQTQQKFVDTRWSDAIRENKPAHDERIEL